MQESLSADFLELGTCSLHPVYTEFKNGLKELHFPFNSFSLDLSFFFHLSNARREDFRSMENVTDIIAHFMKKHGPTRWLFMKLVSMRFLEHLPNLKECFLKFLPRQKGFKSCPRHDKIIEHLTSPLTEPYIAFMVLFLKILRNFCKYFSMISLWFICFDQRWLNWYDL